MLKRGFSFAPGYRLEQFLGRGQFGQVWRASAPGGAAAAIKFIDLSGSEGAKEHEGVKRVKQIRHANLMPITAIWLLDVHGKPIEEQPEITQETLGHIPIDPSATAGDLSSALDATAAAISLPPKNAEAEPAWLVVGMLLGGKSLQQRLRECVKNGLPGIPPKELLAYMDESAKGLDFLNIAQHDLGEGMVAIQHCDVKPANIVLIGSSAVVCDFGLARILTRNQVTATSASGTPAYMAPEAIAGKPSRTSDQYSLAVTYYHLRTGTLPINDGTLWEVLDAHRTGKLDLSRVPEHEQAVLRRATALDWEKRFDSNLDFVESLREALRAEGFTRPVMPAIPNATSPDTMPTNALPTNALPGQSGPNQTGPGHLAHSQPLDPSVTLVPGQDVTTPMAGAAVMAANHLQTTVQSPTTPNAANDDDTKRGLLDRTALDAAPASVGSASESSEAEFNRPQRNEWWLQPQWLALAAIAIVAPMLLMVLLSGGGGDGGDGTGEIKKEEIVESKKSADDWLAEATSLIGKDDGAARLAFDNAVKLEPELASIPGPRLLTGHTGSVRGIEFSGDGQSMVSIADEKAPFSWSLKALAPSLIGRTTSKTNDPQHELVAGPSDMIEAFAADPGRQYFAAADFSGQLTLSSFSDISKPFKSFSLGEQTPESVMWHPVSNDLMVVGASDLSTVVWIPSDATDATETYRFELAGMIQAAALDPQGKCLLIQDSEGVVSRIAWTAIEAIRKVQSAPMPVPITSRGTRVSVMAAMKGMAEGESALVTGGEDGEVTVWSLGDEPNAIQRQPIHGAQVSAIAASSKGLQGPVVTGDVAGMIGVWRSVSSQSITKLPVHRAAIASLDMSDEGSWLAAGSYDGETTLWHLANDRLPMVRLKSNAGPVTFVRMDDLGQWLAVGHEEGVIELWDLRYAKMLVSESAQSSASSEAPPAAPVKPDDSSSI